MSKAPQSPKVVASYSDQGTEVPVYTNSGGTASIALRQGIGNSYEWILGFASSQSEAVRFVASSNEFAWDHLVDEDSELLALFTLQMDELGDLIFTDTHALSFGVGRSVDEAMRDWYSNALESFVRFTELGEKVYPKIAEARDALRRILGEGTDGGDAFER